MRRIKRKLFLVMALHRSGSSACAGTLNRLGIHMGDRLLGAGTGNVKGHFENRRFIKINDQILAGVKRSWKHPASRKRVKRSKISGKKLRVFIKKNAKPVWGLKDPRILLTFDLWKKHLKKSSQITYIFVHRPFEASARSLAKRDKRMSLLRAKRILLIYLKNFHHFRSSLKKSKARVIDISYDQLLQNPQQFVSAINRRLDRRRHYRLRKVRKFLDQSLKHH